MSAQEFVSWQAYLRQHPAGLRWQNWTQAKIRQDLYRLAPRAKGSKLPTLDKFLWKPPEPLIVSRLKAEAKAKRRSSKP